MTKPPPALILKTMPAEVKRQIPPDSEQSQAVQMENFLLHWHRPRKGATYQRGWQLTLWRPANGYSTWQFYRKISLPNCAVPGDSKQLITHWLQPHKARGLILEVAEIMEPESLFVFPDGLTGPLYVFTGGGGSSIAYSAWVNVGPPDSRGFRSLILKENSPADESKLEVTEYRLYLDRKNLGSARPDTHVYTVTCRSLAVGPPNSAPCR